MKKVLRNLTIIAVTAVILFQGIVIVNFYIQNKKLTDEAKDFKNSKLEKLNFIENVNKSYTGREIDAIRAVAKNPKNVEDLHITGWIPDWDINDGYATLRNNINKFSSISPFYFEINADGTLKQTSAYNSTDIKDYSANNNLTFIPTITCFDAGILSSILNDPSIMDRHVQEIMRYINDNNFDGIDLDYEEIFLKDKELYFQLLQKVSSEMTKAEKIFSVTVIAKWGDNDTVYTLFPETREVQDYKRIADLADEFRIMSYEYIPRTSKYYGPIAPLPWFEDILRYAIFAGVPREKILMGIHTYAYNFTDREALPSLSYWPIVKYQYDDSKEAALAYFPKDVDTIKRDFNYTEEFNQEWGEAVLKYNFKGTSRYIVYPSSESIRLRKQLAADYGIKGISIWRLGDEGTLEY